MLSKSHLLSLIRGPRSIRPLKQIHALLLTSGFIHDRLVVAEIAKCFSGFEHHLSYACRILQQVPLHLRSPFIFNLLFSRLASGRNPRLALSFYKCAVDCGFSPDRYTFPMILKSCAKDSGIGEARQVHGVIIKMSFLCDIYVQNSLLHVYAVCGQLADASHLFGEMPLRDVVSWTGLISGYVKGGFPDRARALFQKMDVDPNEATLVSILVACGKLGSAEMGKRIHGSILKRRWETGVLTGNALLDMYVKCECLDNAKQLFAELPCRDIVSWTSIISGLVQCKQPKEALRAFNAMHASGLEPDKVSLPSVLSACASLGALDVGKWVHEFIDKRGIEWDVHIATAMIDMYAKCGSIEMALDIFHKMSCKNIFSWNALLGGLAMHGFGKRVLEYYDQMIISGIVPNEVTFLAILGSCSHSGLVAEGRKYFNAMTEFYNLTPRIEHFGCMVDLLCRAEFLEDAFDVIKSMPMEADVLIWGSMLSACKAQGNVELSQQIIDYVLESKSSDSGVYVLLSNIYATNDKWRDVTRIRKLMKEKGIKKEPGFSLIAVDDGVHEFLVGDSKHPLKEDIWLVLNMLHKQVQLDRR